MNNKHVILGTSEFSFRYTAKPHTLYFCSPSYEDGYELVMWIKRDGTPNGLPEPTENLFKMLHKGIIYVVDIL
jgi:hypothetical protein